MAEYIEREGLMHELGPYEENNFSQEMSVILQIVAGRPAADVAPVVHGCWVYDSGDEYVGHYHCDKCGTEIDLCNEVYTEPKPNYCPNCGAKMGKEDH